MAVFEIKEEGIQGIPVFLMSGYFNVDAATRLTELVKGKLESGQIRIALEFSGCSAVNSPGVATLMDLAILVNDDYRGQMVFCGLDEMKRSFFKMVGIFTAATEVPTKEAAAQKLSAG